MKAEVRMWGLGGWKEYVGKRGAIAVRRKERVWRAEGGGQRGRFLRRKRSKVLSHSSHGSLSKRMGEREREREREREEDKIGHRRIDMKRMG